MQQHQSPDKWAPERDARIAANILLILAYAFAAPVEVILRRRFGRCYLGVPSAVAFFGLLLWPLFFPRDDPRPMLWFTGLFLVMHARARLESVLMVARGDLEHSRYNGWPRLAWVFRTMHERRIKGIVEPAVSVLAGLVIAEESQPVGVYLIFAGIAVALTVDHIDAIARHKVAQMHDAWIEQQQLMKRFREMQRGRFR